MPEVSANYTGKQGDSVTCRRNVTGFHKKLSLNKPVMLVVVTAACLAPFINKPFHIDDPLFLWTAKQIQSKPAVFYGFSVNWYGYEEPMYRVMKNPPLTSYYIAAAASVLGFSEAALHTAFLLPAAAAILGTYYLARRFTAKPALAALSTLLTPAFLVSSTNIMCDTMMLAFWVWAIFLWVRGTNNNDRLCLFCSAVLIALCALTKYFGMSLIALLFAYTLTNKIKPKYILLFLLVPVVILAGYQWLTFSLYGRGLLSDASHYSLTSQYKISVLKVLGVLAFTGGCTITALFFGVLVLPRRAFIPGVAATVLLIIGLISARKIGAIRTYADNHVNWGFVIQLGLMCVAGTGVIWLCAADLLKHRSADSFLLFLWVLGTFVFAGFINWTINARSVLPLIPAVGILIARRVDFKFGEGKIVRWPIIASAVISLLVCRADYVLAGIAPKAAASVMQTTSSSAGAVWFEGHWGFQYYMEALGGKAVDYGNTVFKSRDIIIVPACNTNAEMPPEGFAPKIDVRKYDQFPLAATRSETLYADFYSSSWGPLPYAIGKSGPEVYHICRVK
jgi:4-amino-4-deoxy-L-arabinose transferase-like glycosyltransferase